MTESNRLYKFVDNKYNFYEGEQFFDNINQKSYVKMIRRINNILKQIDKLDSGSCKKYQIKGYYEAKRILNYCRKKNINASLITDEKLKTNKITKIINEHDMKGCGCQDWCDGKFIFHSIKIPRMYVTISK